jgi:hypothetical protein
VNKLQKATQIQSIGIPNTFKDLEKTQIINEISKLNKKQSPSSLASPEKLIGIIIQETNKKLQKKYKYGFKNCVEVQKVFSFNQLYYFCSI